MSRNREAGLTLAEILVVLVLVGVASGAAMLAFGRADAVRVEAEARRLADRLQLASDEALVSGSPLALAWEPEGYHFLRWDPEGGAWKTPSPPLGRHALPRGVSLARLGASGPALVIPPDLDSDLAAFQIRDGASAWRVRFDGLSAAAEPAGD